MVTTAPPPAQDVTPPGAPTGLTATAVSSTRIGLAWTGSTDVGPGVTASDTFNRANGGLGGSVDAAERDVPDREPACGGGGGGHVYDGAADDVDGRRGPVGGGGGDGDGAELGRRAGGAGGATGARPVSGGLQRAGGSPVVSGGGSVWGRRLGGVDDAGGRGDVVRLEATGTTIRVLVNGVQKLSVTDTRGDGRGAGDCMRLRRPASRCSWIRLRRRRPGRW